MQLALCTGRGLSDAKLFSDALHMPADWLITANGADVRAAHRKDAVHHAPLDDVMCDDILAICAQHGSDPCFYTNAGMYYGEAFRAFIGELKRRGHPAAFSEIRSYRYVEPGAWRAVLAQERGQINKAIVYHQAPAVVDRIGASLCAAGLYELAPSVMFGGQLKNIEVNRKGVHKGAALCALARHLGCDMAQVMAIGDSDNDLKMLQVAGLGIAMENASAPVKAVAAAQTGSNDACGVAQAVKHYILADVTA